MICPRCHRRYEEDGVLFCPHDGERLAAAIDIKRIRSKPTELQGTTIGGRYQVRGLLGKGAVARVFLAQDKVTGAPVAVKLLEQKHAQDKELVVRFILEARAAAKVTHRSIVEMLDIGQGEGGAPYLVMELLFGESLGDWIRREKSMSPEMGVPFVRQVAEGLAAVHRAGIIHRDLKPDNIFLVGEKGSPHAAKLVDFGFAKQHEQGALTQAGVTVGTVEYMSPEQAVSDPVDARTDVYGLGVLMYRMFTGRLPFAGAEPADILARHLVQDPAPLGLGTSALASGVEAIVLKALRKRPEHRYASMEALLGDFARLDRGESLSARLPLEEADVYAPASGFSEKAAKFLYARLNG
jgi:serine/threonine-protein kinase